MATRGLMARDLIAELQGVVRALSHAGIEYALCGGIAVTVHGAVRSTKEQAASAIKKALDRAERRATPFEVKRDSYSGTRYLARIPPVPDRIPALLTDLQDELVLSRMAVPLVGSFAVHRIFRDDILQPEGAVLQDALLRRVIHADDPEPIVISF